jgi:hypothetical protein
MDMWQTIFSIVKISDLFRRIRCNGGPRKALVCLRCSPALLLAAALCGCATSDPVPKTAAAPAQHPFNFDTDTFSFRNDLVWEYNYSTNGKTTTHRREPKPDYTLHCFVLARSCRQFFENARFEPEEPVADDCTYRRLIDHVVSTSPRHKVAEGHQVVIPGYADLRSFSAAHPQLLKAECGSAWESYFTRGNWRMVFPFSRHGQEKMAAQLLAHLKPDHPVLIHVSLFPELTINHTLLIFGATETQTEIQFTIYDPNQPEGPASLKFDRAKRTFLLPANQYFAGGPVDVYEVCHKWDF